MTQTFITGLPFSEQNAHADVIRAGLRQTALDAQISEDGMSHKVNVLILFAGDNARIPIVFDEARLMDNLRRFLVAENLIWENDEDFSLNITYASIITYAESFAGSPYFQTTATVQISCG